MERADKSLREELMTLPQTETTNMKVWQESVWRIRPLNVPVLSLAPPPTRTDLEAHEFEGVGGGFELIRPLRKGTIDTATHQTLLKQSLREYEEIWRTLAER